MRLLTIFLSIALLGNATAQTFGLYSYRVNPDNVSVTITDYDTSGTGELEIVDTLGGYPVTSIGDYAFYQCTGLTSATIGNSVTSIGSSAFSFCTGLTSITIPNSVTSIGNYAFYNCSGLTSIVVAVDNPNYSSIGPLLLNKNGTVLITAPSASGDFTIPNSVTSIGNYAFYYCTGLTSVTIPDSVTSIGNHAFGDCTSLTSITIPDSVTSIGDSAFSTAYIILPDIVCGFSEDYNYYPNDKEAAEQGYVTAQYRLGVAYDNGYGVPEDDVEAVKWYRKAAEQGHADAQYNLGSAYATGEGVAKDDVMAVKWFRKAAEQRHTEAQSWLGEMYYYGKGVPEDIVWALVWKGLAHKVDIWLFDQGSFPKKMTREQITEAQRLYQEWLEKRSSDDNT